MKNVIKLVGLSIIGIMACEDDEPQDDVIVRYRTDVDFGEYRTFHIVNELTEGDLVDGGVDPEDIPDEVMLNINAANAQAEEELEALGLTEVPQEEADLLLFSLGATSDEEALYWECVPGYWWGYWGWVWDPCAWTVPIEVNYTVGTVMVGLADPAMDEVVFGGVVQGIADGSNPTGRITDGVRRIFDQYPEGPSDE